MKIKLGISSCLLGKTVRFDGGHKLDRFLKDTLGKFVDFVPVCPELEAGFGIPREAMRLVGDPSSPRLLTSKTHVDCTDRMQLWIDKRLDGLEDEDLCGFVFKKDSPSSGMERVKVYNEKGFARKNGVGLFARAFMLRFPLVPVEEEGRLHDNVLRENFIVRIFAYRRWKDQCTVEKKPSVLIEFYARHKYLLMAHSPSIQKELGKLVADVKNISPDEFCTTYESLFMKALKYIATVKKNSNVLMHLAGYFRNRITDEEKVELHEIIEQYRLGLIPLIVPVTIINHYVRKYKEEYLSSQYYLYPHPLELKLRNHA